MSKKHLEKFFKFFRIAPKIGGLEIADTAFHFAYFDGEKWKYSLLRLPPGILEGGLIKNSEQFVEALKYFREQILKDNRDFSPRQPISIIVSLGSIHIYSHVFALPLISGENLERAVALNIQMLSPAGMSRNYAGWQVVGHDPQALKIEILSAFIDRSFVDEIVKSLEKAGFLAMAIEPGALSLTRLIKETAVIDSQKSYIVLRVDNSGLDFLIIRNTQLYFEYFNSWEDIQGEKKQILLENFQEIIVKNLHQVMNFYASNWQTRPTDILISAKSFPEEISKAIKDNFSLNINQLKLRIEGNVEDDWHLAIGSGLRGLVPRSKDEEMSLLGISSQEEYRRQQIISFLEFWRLLMPASLGVLLVSFIIANLFLINVQKSLESRTIFNTSGEQLRQADSLSQQISAFNKSVQLISSLENSLHPKSSFLAKFNRLLAAQGVLINRLTFSNYNSPLILSAEAKSQDQILSFKKALESDPQFSSVDLSLTDIKPTAGGYSFSLSFSIRP